MNYFIISPVYNAENYIKNCIDSVQCQVVPHGSKIHHIIINDCSTDKTLDNIKIGNNTYVINHPFRQGTMNSHLDGIEKVYSLSANENDVIIHLDGDDWLENNQAIMRLDEEYSDINCWVTYGNYKTTDGSRSICKPIINDKFREKIYEGWCFSHLRTFRLKLFTKLHLDDLKDNSYKYFSSAQDVAIFLPILEMAGPKRIRFIEDILCVYNNNNPLNDHKVRLQDQVRCALQIAKKPRYKEL